MQTLSIDIETYSDVNLSKCGVYKYAESPDFEILLFGYSVDGSEVTVIDLAQGERLPQEIIDALTDDTVIKWAFNANFERVCLSRYLRDLGVSLDPFHDNHPLSTECARFLNPESRKLDALEDIIEAANEKPLLVAYWFRHDLSRIKNRFNVREIKTSRDIADWNAGKIPVAVIHPASAGHGLNLQAGGSTLVWFGLTWSLELYQQTNARLWRQGQESGTVVIQHIITKGTIDEMIVKALSKKEMTQTALIDAVKADLEVV